MEVKIRCRLAFPFVFEVRPPQEAGKKGKFEASGIFPPGSPAHVAVKEAYRAAATEKWGENGPKILQTLERNKFSLRKGDLNLDKSSEVYGGFEGMLYLVAKSDTRPTVVALNGRTPLTREDGKPYAGCDVIMIVDCYVQDGKNGKGAFAELKGLQFAGDNDAFTSNRIVTADDFEDLSGGAAPAESAEDSLV